MITSSDQVIAYQHRGILHITSEMTHGAGGLSGGGFGFGGGILSTSSGGRCDCTSCIVCAVYGIIVVLIISLALFGVFGSVTSESSATDMRTVSNVFPVMCQSVTVKSSDPFDAYLLSSQPQINATVTHEFNITRSMSIGSERYEYWGFYLLKGSTVTVKTSTTSSIYLYVIRGFSNLQKWISNSCYKCYITFDYIVQSDTYRLDITSTDDYYFVFANKRYSLAFVVAKFRLRRTLYDVSDASTNCSVRVVNSKFQCTFDLSLGSSQNVVYQNGPREEGKTIDMVTICHPRILMCLILFLPLPVIFGVTVSIANWKLCAKNSRKE